MSPKPTSELSQFWRLMEKQIHGKRGLFTPEELDVVVCALISQQSEFRKLLPIMEKYANPKHLANHLERIAIGEKLLNDLADLV